MIRQLALFSFFCFCILGCRDTVHTVGDPGEPIHTLQIEGEVQFYGEVSWSASDDTLNTRIWAENVGADTASIASGPCAFNVIAYNGDGEPVWHNRLPDGYACPDVLIAYEIAPGEKKQLTDQLYISGKHWYWDIPAGDWGFNIESRTEEGELISFSAN